MREERGRIGEEDFSWGSHESFPSKEGELPQGPWRLAMHFLQDYSWGPKLSKLKGQGPREEGNRCHPSKSAQQDRSCCPEVILSGSCRRGQLAGVGDIVKRISAGADAQRGAGAANQRKGHVSGLRICRSRPRSRSDEGPRKLPTSVFQTRLGPERRSQPVPASRYILAPRFFSPAYHAQPVLAPGSWQSSSQTASSWGEVQWAKRSCFPSHFPGITASLTCNRPSGRKAEASTTRVRLRLWLSAAVRISITREWPEASWKCLSFHPQRKARHSHHEEL